MQLSILYLEERPDAFRPVFSKANPGMTLEWTGMRGKTELRSPREAKINHMVFLLAQVGSVTLDKKSF